MSMKGQSIRSLRADEISTMGRIRSTLNWELPVDFLGLFLVEGVISGFDNPHSSLIKAAICVFFLWLSRTFRHLYRLWRIRRELAGRRSHHNLMGT